MGRKTVFSPLLVLSILFACSGLARAQEDWEGKTVEEIRGKGFQIVSFRNLKDQLAVARDKPYTMTQRDGDLQYLWKTKYFDDARIEVTPGSQPGRIIVTVVVVEAPVIEDVRFDGLKAIPLAILRPKLRLNPNERMNPFHLKVDRDAIREEYILKGYHFSSVRDEVAASPGGVILTWHITEGPLVTVREIQFTGNRSIPEGKLRDVMLLRENSSFLWILPANREPFVQHYLDESLKRLKLFYQLEGWLDIADPKANNVFVEDLAFNEDKTEVTIKIHIDEGRRYVIRSIELHGAMLFPKEQMTAWLHSKVGQDYNDNVAGKDAQRIRERYGERAYILAEVAHQYRVDYVRRELDLVFEIKEGQEIRVGRITVQGNTRTRADVILRELRDFAPGEKFNNRLLNRGVLRLRDRGFFDVQGGIVPRLEESEAKDVRDVILDVKEGQTGSVRFAGGYSSSFGILGLFEFTQKNFDLSDFPTSIDDLFSGNAFVGGGQIFSLRLSPSARRQSFVVEFREPYVFGYEIGFGTRGYHVQTEREDWDEGRTGFTLSVDKRLDAFRMELKFNAFRIEIDDLDSGAPASVADLAGENRIYSLTPAITFDTRDSQLFATEGVRLTLSLEYAGQLLAGDFDYNKVVIDGEIHHTVFETEDRLKHVLSLDAKFGWVEERRDTTDVPFFERFYAGGRDSIRGFEFRGIGPKENGDPVGGEALAFGSLEYTYPLFVEFLRGAFFYDVANLSSNIDQLEHDEWRQSVGFGIRFVIPQLGNIPVALDFGFPLNKDDEDDRQTVTFDIGKLF